MRKFKITGDFLEKWLYQNRAFIEECVDGCLLDNLLITTKRGQAAIIETPVNCWTSCYMVYFSTDGASSDLFYKVTEGRATA